MALGAGVSGGDEDAFERQRGLYTVCVRGIEDEQPMHESVVSAACWVLAATTRTQ